MGTEGLLSPQMLWLLLWVQLCRGKCQSPCPTAQGQRVPAWSSGSVWEWGCFAGATEMRVRRCPSPWTLCLPVWVGDSNSFSRAPVLKAACAWLDS